MADPFAGLGTVVKDPDEFAGLGRTVKTSPTLSAVIDENVQGIDPPPKPVTPHAGIPRPVSERDVAGIPGRAFGILTPIEAEGYARTGRAIIDGARDMLVGLLTFVPDILGAEASSRAIERAIPRLPEGSLGPRTGVEAIISTATQFAPPSLAGTALLQSVPALARRAAPVAAKTIKIGENFITIGVKSRLGRRAVDSLVRFSTNLLGAAGADVAVATPDETETIGNALRAVFKWDVPTATRKGEKRISKRGKIGLEAALVFSGATPIINGLVIGVRGLAKILRPLFRTEQVAAEVAAKSIVEIASDPKNAIANLEKNIREHGGFSTLGEGSGDVGLIGAQKGLVTESSRTRGVPSPSVILTEKKLAQQAQIAGELEGIPTRPGSGEATQEFFGAERAKTIAAVEGEEVAAKKALDRATDDLDNEVARVGEFRPGDKPSSIAFDEQARTDLINRTRIKNQKFDEIDPGGKVIIDDVEDMKSAYNASVRKGSKGDLSAGRAQGLPVMKAARNILFGKKKVGGGVAGFRGPGVEAPAPAMPTVTFKSLQDLRPELSRAMSIARRSNDGALFKRLSAFKEAIEAETGKLAALGDGSAASARAREALAYFTQEFVPRFRQGVGKAFATAIRQESPIPGSAVLERFQKSAGGAVESAEDLKRLVLGFDDPKQAEASVRSFMLSKLARTAVTPEGGLRKAQIAAFIDNNMEILNRFPAIKREVLEYQARIGTQQGKVLALSKELDEARGKVQMSNRDARISTTSVFLNKDPIKAIDGILKSPNPGKQMAEVIALAKRDPTGQALEGLRDSLKEVINQRVSSSLRNLDDVLPAQLSQAERLFQNPVTRKAISQLYTPAEMKVLDGVRNKLSLMERMRLQVTTGSATKPLEQNLNRFRIVLASVYGIVRGRGIFAISEFVLRSMGKDPVALAQAILAEIFTNPVIGKDLLKQGSRANIRQALIKVKANLGNNLAPAAIRRRESDVRDIQKTLKNIGAAL
jgi:hypothetical protein